MKIVNAGLRVLALLDKLASMEALTPGYKLVPLESAHAMKTKDPSAGIAAFDITGKTRIKKSMHKTNLWKYSVRFSVLYDISN